MSEIEREPFQISSHRIYFRHHFAFSVAHNDFWTKCDGQCVQQIKELGTKGTLNHSLRSLWTYLCKNKNKIKNKKQFFKNLGKWTLPNQKTLKLLIAVPMQSHSQVKSLTAAQLHRAQCWLWDTLLWEQTIHWRETNGSGITFPLKDTWSLFSVNPSSWLDSAYSSDQTSMLKTPRCVQTSQIFSGQ